MLCILVLEVYQLQRAYQSKFLYNTREILSNVYHVLTHALHKVQSWKRITRPQPVVSSFHVGFLGEDYSRGRMQTRMALAVQHTTRVLLLLRFRG